MQATNPTATRLVAMLIFSISNAAPAAATVETFESYTDGTILTTQIPGLTISADTGTPTIVTATTPVVPGQPKGLAHIPYFDFPDYLHIDFAPATSTVGAIVDFGNIGNGVRLTAYSGLGQTGGILGTATTTTETFLSVTAAGIRSARFENLGNASYLIDNLTYQLVPEPASTASIGIAAMLVVAGRTQRKRRRDCKGDSAGIALRVK